MVIVNRLIVFGGIIHGVMFKADAAGLKLICKREIVEGFPRSGGLKLLKFEPFEGLERIRRLTQWVEDLRGSQTVSTVQNGA